ncbi:MAG: LrgB family protein [Hyphomicrobiaceae bacterium]|nr:LrgB family protein [Hyphomicrobiaceae bacterium]
MEIARSIGGVPPVTACLTIITGIIGAITGRYILTWIGAISPVVRGVALGGLAPSSAASAVIRRPVSIATARALSEWDLAHAQTDRHEHPRGSR